MSTERLITEVAPQYAQRTGVRPEIHPEDFIFQFLINNTSFRVQEHAVKYYFEDGQNSALQLAKLLNAHQIDMNKTQTMLEFASGYGCLSRHLHNHLGQLSITSCDIHSEAVSFIADQLGLDAILSTHQPEDFTIPDTYDIVFALSFFSHMPKRTWAKWLSTLFDKVAKNGVLIFTTHGTSSAKHFNYPTLDPDGFWFLADSEQKDLDTAQYGQTITNEQYVTRTVNDKLNRTIEQYYPAYWWGHQDCYVIRK